MTKPYQISVESAFCSPEVATRTARAAANVSDQPVKITVEGITVGQVSPDKNGRTGVGYSRRFGDAWDAFSKRRRDQAPQN
ncbi:hypothetical protein A3K55_01655 [Candidatus Shapirobacteria bacterium RBG_13_44_7]|uniref:Uncharacterized protein n=1 Tax=Candidatus Shapirobacteria bacterium RBG_13_44_7 TaxID=1802149 RepID=A0A1F7SJA1_9BACT|nr:MAG: hypothetical protein A3K55_01655 [Candidatus Shapirobacteria bacterium RBG_13_44_7]